MTVTLRTILKRELSYVILSLQISVIFHVAATVRFDEKLNTAVAINVRGTKEIIDLARSCPLLEVLVHVSTAYSHCPRKDIQEKFYTGPYDPQKLLDIAAAVPDGLISKITPE